MDITETDHGTVRMVSQAVIIDDTIETAWAEKYIRANDHHAWILGKYVEADNANRNRQQFPLEDLRAHGDSLNHSPLNIGHAFPFVGAFVANELLYPATAEQEENPFIEALAVMWKSAFPDEYKRVEAAYKEGKLAYSMEALPTTVTCEGAHGCGQTFQYVGRTDVSYCDHVNRPSPETAKVFRKPAFTGGALIIPPVQPGWANADITQVASDQEIESTLQAVEAEFSHLSPREWEEMMNTIVSSYKKA